ncbi:beta-glucosidase [Moniliophthora roreri]|nr:beta-glucosidase [Moniliophthora roreri]
MTKSNVDETLSKLTMPDKIRLLCGLGWWHTEPVPSLCIPSMRMSDGPNGVRGTQFFNGVPSSCFPSSTGLGSTFDIDLARQVGEALADECRAKGCHILLGPTTNTQRSPLGGRSFESFSEDPVLNGSIAAAYINGLQSKGVAATLKHYVANDQEFERFSVSSEVSERALREIYLKPFQIAIRESNPWALMSSYNRVNGLHVSENKWLLDDILRKEWGYKGMIMSDWIGVYSTAESIRAGLDLEMPGPTVMRGNAVMRALAAQKLFPSDIDDRVRKILELLEKAFASGIPFGAPEKPVDTPELRQLLRTTAADSVVLLKNTKNLLPLTSSSNIKKIAVIGPNAKTAFTSGGGSARLLESWKVTLLQGITAAAKEIDADVQYTIGATSHKMLPLAEDVVFQHGGQPGGVLEFWNEKPSEDFLSTKADIGNLNEGVVWSTTTKSTNCILLDGVNANKVDYNCYFRYTTTFIPDESGDWIFGVSVSGLGNVFIDGKLAIDLSNDPPKGNHLIGVGTAELCGIVKDMQKGQKYSLEIRISNLEFMAQIPIIPAWGGFRLGAMKVMEPEQAIKDAVKLAKESDVAILVVGLNHEWESENYDREDLSLPGLTNRLVTEVLAANPQTVVVNQSGSAVELPWADEASTVLQAFFGGNELGNGVADVLFGKVNPSAKLSLTFPKRLADCPAYPSYGNKTQDHGKVLYNEGVFVGYRGYQIKSIAPAFPFGFGLSYTQFEYSDLQSTPISSDGSFTVALKVKNVGQINGREVVQIYISDPESSLARAKQELRGFKKVSLKAGETKEVKVELDRDALGFYDERRGSWVAERGKFGVLAGASSEDIRLRTEVELKDTLTWTGL